MLADYLHLHSTRSGNTFLKINCAAFPESLLDNELFGHEKGSYTGADSSFPGIFERVDGGTLFLDEIGDMPPLIQAKILRVLQNNEIRRIGGKDMITVDVRFIAASNKNLTRMIENGQFREDLMFRLNAAVLHIPLLRERREDIPVLAKRFMEEINRSEKSDEKVLSDEIMRRFMGYQWPGNVRELKNAVRYACAMSQGDVVKIDDLPPILQMDADHSGGAASVELDPRSKAEASVIRDTLKQVANNKKRAAELLNMSRNTLYKKLALYGIDDPDG
jgi:DNA-binding NtrC family response regulator